jgi:hypothetical protein
MSSLGFTGVAAGDIYPARFVKAAPGGFSCAQCVANDPVFGISQLGTNGPPIPGTTYDKAAIAGGSLRIHKPGERCFIQAGAAIVSGNRLKSDVNGMGVPLANNVTSGEQFGAVALQDAQVNEFCECEVVIGSHTGA